MQRAHERSVILEFAVERFERFLEKQSCRVGARSVEPRHHFVFVEHRLHEALVLRRVDRRRVPACRHDAERLVPHILEHAFVHACRIAQHRDLGFQAVFVKLAKKTQSVDTRKPRVYGVDVRLDLAHI